MRGLIALCLGLVVVLVAMSPASAGVTVTCDVCACKFETRTLSKRCCEPVRAGKDGGAGEGAGARVGDMMGSACWLDGEGDKDACGLICAPLSEERPDPCASRGYREPPCDPVEEYEVELTAEYTVAAPVIEKKASSEGTCAAFCPSVETGQCVDSVNNDAWLDDETDCADGDCFSDSNCSRAPAPTASPYGIAALLIALGGFGAWRLSRRAVA